MLFSNWAELSNQADIFKEKKNNNKKNKQKHKQKTPQNRKIEIKA